MLPIGKLIEYDLPEGYTRFKVRAGLDKTGVEATKPGATVKFAVFKQDRTVIAAAKRRLPAKPQAVPPVLPTRPIRWSSPPSRLYAIRKPPRLVIADC